MKPIKPIKLILAAVPFLVAGFVILFLIVIQLLESTLALNFLAFFSSTLGLVLGLTGTAMHLHMHDHRREIGMRDE